MFKPLSRALALLLAMGPLGASVDGAASEPIRPPLTVLDVKQFGAAGSDLGNTGTTSTGFGRIGEGGQVILDVDNGESFQIGQGIHLWRDEEPLTLAAVDVGRSDLVAELSEISGNGHSHCVGGLAFRIRDAKNFWVVRRFSLQANGVSFRVAKVERGVYRELGAVRQDNGQRIRVVAKGPVIRVSTDGKLLAEYTDTFCERETKVGLHHGGPEGVNDGDRNFRCWYEGAGQPVYTGFRVTDETGNVLAEDDFSGQAWYAPLKATKTGQAWQMLAGEFVSSATAHAICHTGNRGTGLSATVTAVVGNMIKMDRPWPGRPGDGVQLRHDDTAAFQRALAAARPPAILALPDGMYPLSQSLVIPKGVALIGVPARGGTFVSVAALPGFAPGPKERFLVDIASDDPAWQALERVDLQGLRLDTNPGLSGIRIRGQGGRYDGSNILFRRRGVVVEGGGRHVVRSFCCYALSSKTAGPAYNAIGGSVLPVFDNLKVAFQGTNIGFLVDAPDGGVDLRALNSEQPLRPLVAMRYKELIAAGCIPCCNEARERYDERHPAIELNGGGIALVDGIACGFPVSVSRDGKTVAAGMRKEDIGTAAEWKPYRLPAEESRLVRDSFAWGETGEWPRFQAWMAPYLPSVKDFGASGSAARTAGKANGTALAVADVMDFTAGQGIYLWDTAAGRGLATMVAKAEGTTFTLAAPWPGTADTAVEVYHDDWPAIRAAQRALFGAKIPRTERTDPNVDDFMRGRLLFPPGTYNISQTLEATVNSGLVGLPGPKGESPRIVALPGFAPQAKEERWIIHFVNGHGRLDTCANDNFHEQCEGLELDALRPETNPGLSGLFLAASIGSRFSHLAIRGFRKRGLVLSYGCDNNSYRDLEIDPAHDLPIEGPAITMGGNNTNTLMFERVAIRNLRAGIGVEIPSTFGGVEFRSLHFSNVARPVVGTYCGSLNLYGLIVSADPAKVSGPAVELVGHNNVFVDGITDCYATGVRVEAPGQQAVTLAGSRQPGQWRRFRWCVNSPTLTIEDGDPPPGAHAKREGYHQALGQRKAD